MSGQPDDDTNSSNQDTAALFRVAYDTLHGMAAGYLRGERADHTLQPTALVHEAYLKLDRPGQSHGWQGKTHFRAVAARAMRQILVDHARQRNAQKRGGDWHRVTLACGDLGHQQDVDFMALDEAMNQLSELAERKAQVVELRFFGGLTNSEAARHLGISPKTAEADWYFARAWLRKQLAET